MRTTLAAVALLTVGFSTGVSALSVLAAQQAPASRSGAAVAVLPLGDAAMQEGPFAEGSSADYGAHLVDGRSGQEDLQFGLICNYRDQVKAYPNEQVSGFRPDGSWEGQSRMRIDLQRMGYCKTGLCRSFGVLPIARVTPEEIVLDDQPRDPEIVTLIRRSDLRYFSKLSGDEDAVIVTHGTCVQRPFSGFGEAGG